LEATGNCLAETNTMSWRKIAETLGKPKSSVSDLLRDYYLSKFEERVSDMYDEPLPSNDELTEHDNSRILFISDLHFPFHHPNTFEFLQMLKDRYNPTRVICLGDETDKHAMSFHDSDPDLMSAGDELRKHYH